MPPIDFGLDDLSISEGGLDPLLTSPCVFPSYPAKLLNISHDALLDASLLECTRRDLPPMSCLERARLVHMTLAPSPEKQCGTAPSEWKQPAQTNLASIMLGEVDLLEPVPLSDFLLEVSGNNNKRTRSTDVATPPRKRSRNTAPQSPSSLHQAILQKSSAAQMIALIDSDPSELTRRNGPQKLTPLSMLFKARNFSPREKAELADFMLSKSPMCATVTDRHDNTPLHQLLMSSLAASSSSSSAAAAGKDIVLRMIELYPRALFHKNFYGKSPLDICRERAVSCSEQVAQLVWTETARRNNDMTKA